MINPFVIYLIVGFIFSLIGIAFILYREYKDNYNDDHINNELGIFAILLVLFTFAYPIAIFIFILYMIIWLINKIVRYIYYKRNK